MAELTREQMTIRLNYIAAMLEPDDMTWFEPLRDMALRACDAPEVEALKSVQADASQKLLDDDMKAAMQAGRKHD